MTGEELIQHLKDLKLTPQMFSNGNVKNIGIEYKKVSLEYDNISSYESRMILHFPLYDIYLMVVGYYNSYDGDNFDDEEFQVVKPVRKKITIYK